MAEPFLSAGPYCRSIALKRTQWAESPLLGSPCCGNFPKQKSPAKGRALGETFTFLINLVFNYVRLRMNFFRRLCYKYVVVSSPQCGENTAC